MQNCPISKGRLVVKTAAVENDKDDAGLCGKVTNQHLGEAIRRLLVTFRFNTVAEGSNSKWSAGFGPQILSPPQCILSPDRSSNQAAQSWYPHSHMLHVLHSHSSSVLPT